jgi:sugar O-acyltransferase (sialic acid O-acetyltransferase NeuD family)
VADVLLANDPSARLLFIDANARDGERLFGFEVVRSADLARFERIFVALGDNARRAQAYATVDKRKLAQIISKSACLSPTAQFGAGCFIGNSVHVGPFVTIGDNTILNTGCVVEHEVKVGSHCHIGPNATISGRTTIGDHVFVGVGATIIDNVKVCGNVIIGGGATVVKDISEPGTYVGVPVRKVRAAEAPT